MTKTDTNSLLLEKFAEHHNLDPKVMQEALLDTKRVIQQLRENKNVEITPEVCIQAFIIGHEIRMKHYQDILDNKDGLGDKLRDEVYKLIKESK